MIKKILILFAILTFSTACFGQAAALQHLINGKKFFWEARFADALEELSKVTEVVNARSEYIFEAYLYTGFTLQRQNASASEIEAAFTEAVRADPQRELDEIVIPPDLAAPFNKVRNEIVGCLYVYTEPIATTVVGVLGDSVLFEKIAPLTICEPASKQYQLLFTQEGFHQRFIPLKVSPGKTDTVEVLMVPLSTTKVAKRGGKSGLKKWAIRGGVAVGAAAILYTTVLSKDGSTDGSGGGDSLPTPPTHPTGQ